MGNVNIAAFPLMGPQGLLYPFAQVSLSYASVSVRLCKASELLVWPLYAWLVSLLYISPTSSDTWESFLSFVMLDFGLHFYKTSEG